MKGKGGLEIGKETSVDPAEVRNLLPVTYWTPIHLLKLDTCYLLLIQTLIQINTSRGLRKLDTYSTLIYNNRFIQAENN